MGSSEDAFSFADPLGAGMATLIGGGSREDIIGAVDPFDLTGTRAGQNAIDAQRYASDQANETLRYMYDTQRADLQPWRETGVRALSGLERNTFMNDFEGDPGYQFRLEQGQKALENSAAARGMLNSGATMKALTRYGQDYASNEYDRAYNREYNRLSGLAGVGNSANVAQVNAAGSYGSSVAGNQIGLGNSIAANEIAMANQRAGLAGQGAGLAMLAFSDKRLKTNLAHVSIADLDEMKRHLKAFAFNYKNDRYGTGKWVGVMAQDLEKSKLGRTLVVTNEHGEKQIDLKKVLSMFLATMAEA